MVINKNSQLGLMMDDLNVRVDFLNSIRNRTLKRKDEVDRGLANKDEGGICHYSIEADTDDKELAQANLELTASNLQLRDKIFEGIGDRMESIVDNVNSKLYLICDGVEKCSKMIKVGDNFSSRALKNVKDGKHTYLLGKNEMCRFLCRNGGIVGIYWNKAEDISFEFGFDLQSNGFWFDPKYAKSFVRVTKILTFVELGDIEITMLEKGRNNGKPKKDGKVTNTSNYTVYVVDSSWNKLIIRTEGFAVMGHFRLQPCGPGMIDRKLIWINAFEKHGYTRKPRAEIIK